jgi:hypothetical protein
VAILNTVRGSHTAPGIYTKEREYLSSSGTTYGITSLGLSGETLKGPAFSPISISSWQEYTEIFGSTSTEIYKASKYPRYELPYIAKDYLSESNNLTVTRVLGLSGYTAGQAWLITSAGEGQGNNMLVAVLRSRGHYVKAYGNPSFSSEPVASGELEKNTQYVIGRINQEDKTPLSASDYVTLPGDTTHYTFGSRFTATQDGGTYTVNPSGASAKLTVYGYCGTNYEYDKFLWDTYDVSISPASISAANFTCGKAGSWDGTAASSIPCSPSDFGTFKLTVTLRNSDGSAGRAVEYTVSFNPGQKNHINKVLGSTPDDNNTPIYVEELYDVALQQLIYKNGIDVENYISGISQTLTNIGEDGAIIPKYAPVTSILVLPSQSLTKSLLGKRYIYTGYDENGDDFKTEYVEERIHIIKRPYSRTVDTVINMLGDDDHGKILVVAEDVDASGRTSYNYHYVITETQAGEDDTPEVYFEKLDPQQGKNPYTDGYWYGSIYVESEKLFYSIDSLNRVNRIRGDVTDYREGYRYASTPWIVSQMSGTFANNEVKRLFRFHTISDGNTANTLFKISIENIDPDRLTFDVVIRDFNDTDESINEYERFTRCTLNPQSSSYISNRIGSIDNSFPVKSRFVMVETAENENIRFSIPCGFLGYPVRDLSVYNIKIPTLKYNTTLNEDLKNSRQYFGLSDITGIDADILSYKGKAAYTDYVFTDGFHLDSRISNENTLVDGENPDGIYTWQTVSVDTTGEGGEAPQITGDDITGTIYEDSTTRKFTLCAYGGFDGWDIYRTSRTTSDDFKANRYKGKINALTGEGDHFSSTIKDETISFPEKAITSDYYAFWAGILTFNNPKETPVNVIATPGIDAVNDTLLVHEAIEMIEDSTHQSAIYIVTTPDKPFGASDTVQAMYTAKEAVANIEYSEINSSYTATYYPWVRYEDEDENKSLYLPVTRDVIRNIAIIDNTSYSWYPPAGDERGKVLGTPKKNLKAVEEDVLYSGRINPIETHSKEGAFIWGQKTLKISRDNDRESLTRVGVRRMMLRIRDLILRANRNLIFQPNDSTLETKFRSNSNAILNDVQNNRGISKSSISVENTVEAQEARTIPARIFVVPINMLENVEIEFAITGAGVTNPGLE